MAHEVVKRVGRRAYRYRVESYRDPDTNKTRARWTYLGVAAADGPVEAAAIPSIRTPGKTRERLLDAFARIAERERYADITAGAVAQEAGLAHGTFYRYFRDKRDLVTASVDRVRDDLARTAPSFEPPYGTADSERLRVKSWVLAMLAKPGDHPGLLRACVEAMEADVKLRTLREQRRSERVAAFARYLEALAAAGTIAPVKSKPLAVALFTIVDASFRAALAARQAVHPEAVVGALEAFDRAIFEPRSASLR